jgi:hypothetical protein
VASVPPAEPLAVPAVRAASATATPAATTNNAWPSPRLAGPQQRAPAEPPAQAPACAQRASALVAAPPDSRAVDPATPAVAPAFPVAVACVRPVATRVKPVVLARTEPTDVWPARCAIRPQVCAPCAGRQARPVARAIPAVAVAASTAVAWPTAPPAPAPAQATATVRASRGAARAAMQTSRAA